MLIKKKDYYKIKGIPISTLEDPDSLIAEYIDEFINDLSDFDYNYDKDKNMITLIGKKP